MSGPIVPYIPHNDQIQNHRGHDNQDNHQVLDTMICNYCRTVLNHPRGATRVCCSVCRNIKSMPAEEANLQCNGCGLMLVYDGQALAVKCVSCSTITCTKPPNADSDEDNQTVIVENPNTLDDNGLLIGSLGVGIRAKRRP